MTGRFLWAVVVGALLCIAVEASGQPREALQYRRELTREAHLAWGLTAPVPALAAQLEQESAWNPAARSRVGALGLAQFMPATARDFPDEKGEVLPLNASWAMRAQSRYMRRLFLAVEYPRECDRYGAALAAYNGGLGWHNKRRAAANDPADFWNSVRTINPGIAPANQRENEEYPQRILFQRQRNYETWGRLLCG